MEELWVVGEDLRRQNQELFRERQRYADLFNFAPDAYLVTDPEGIIQEANQAAAKLFHCPQEFLRGKPLVVFVTEEEHRAFRTRLASLKTAGVEKVDDWRVTIRPRQSPAFHAIMTVSAKPDPVSRFIGIRWLVRATLDGSAPPSPPL
ncbi:MAG: PAS domain-containing protein [Deltaproteobacteria bacterium]|nr:PAS domain-containing protein [Deltaproteobacteria bacterium]